MNICFPARKSHGENYTDLNEIMDNIGREPHGTWLAGTNNMWHGGIHITPVTTPDAILTADNVDSAIPLQCMADGEIVACRINQDYITSTYLSKPLQYSTTFLLVKSTCKPDPQQENTWLEFYSLYMGLAPLSAYPKHKTLKALKTVLRHPAGSYESSASADGVANVTPGQGHLNEGSRVIILKEAQFRNHDEEQPFGLAKCLNDNGETTGDTFWVTLLPEYMTQDGEQYAALPLWMSHAIAQGGFDCVVKPSAPLTISAGDAVGFLAKDICPVGMGKTDTSYFSHIEVLSTDSRMPDFLSNPGKVTTGKKYIRLGLHKPLYIRKGDTFEIMAAITERDGGKVLELDKCNPQTIDGRTWYQIRPHTWMSPDDVDELHQFDLTEREFSAFVEPSTRDMQASLREGWVRDAFIWLAERINPSKGLQQAAVSRFYKGMLDKLDTNHDGELSGRELFMAMHYPEMGVRRVVARMAVKHDSEWFGGSRHHRWEMLFQNYDVLRISYTKKWLDDCEWMSQVPPFDKGEAVWHMHPVVFLDAISIKERCKEFFGKISEIILRHEGGYVNDPDDKGGETNMGITIGTWSRFSMKDLGIQASSDTLKAMTKSQAETVYYNNFWEPQGFCKLESTKIALMIYDWTITSRWAIREVRTLIHNEYCDNLVISNTMDDDMIHCINAINSQESFLQRLAQFRKEYYTSLTITDGQQNKQIKYLKGWNSRVDDCLKVSI